MTLETFTNATFEKHLGERFQIHFGGQHPLNVALTSVTTLSTGVTGSRPSHLKREPFALVFHGPPDILLPQGTYTFEHPGMGTFDMFIVPVIPDEHGTRYEAIFS